MYSTHGIGKRICAMMLSIALLITMLPTTVFADDEQAVIKDNADLVAENYADILSAQEEAILQSGMLTVTQTHEFTAPGKNEEGLITVDSDAKTVEVEPYVHNGYTWTIKEVRLEPDQGEAEIIVLDNEGKGTFQYGDDMYTIEVDYELHIDVDVTEQASLLNAPHYLAAGIANLDAIAALKNDLIAFSTYIESIYTNLIIGHSMSMGGGTVSLKLKDGDARTAFIELYNQWSANGGKLKLTKEIENYQAAANKLVYLKKNGQALKDLFDETYGYFNDIYTDYTDTAGKIPEVLASIKNAADWGLIDASIYDQVNDALSAALGDTLGAELITPMSTIAADPWTILTITWPVNDATMADETALAQLQLLVEAAAGNSAEHDTTALQTSLLANKATVEANVNRHDVTVKVEGYYIAGIDSDDLTVQSTNIAEVLKMPEGSTKEQVEAALNATTAQADGLAQLVAALPGVGFDGEGYEVVIDYNGGAALTGDATYTIKYMPKRMTVTHDLGSVLPTEVYYGYRMTLPMHEGADQVYDYTVNGVFHNQGEMIVILEPTTISRVEGEPWTQVTYNKGAMELLNYALLASPALKVDSSEWFQIRYPKGDLVSTAGNVLTAQDSETGYAGLKWTAVTGTVYSGESVVDTISFENNKITVDMEYDYVIVNYEVVINGHFSDDLMLESLNLPYVLYSQYADQKAAMDGLCYANGGSGAASTLMSGLKKFNAEMIDMLPGLVGFLGDEADEAIYSLRDNCFDAVKGAPYLLEYLQGYRDNGMVYFYTDDNYEKLNSQLLLLQKNMDAILNDPALTSTLEKFNVAQYETQIREVADALRGVVLMAPHEDILRDALPADLQNLVNSIAAASGAVEYTSVPEMKLHYTEKEDAINKKSVTITVVVKDSAGNIRADLGGTYSVSFDIDSVLVAADIQLLADKLIELKTGISEKYYVVTEEGALPAVGYVMSDNVTYTVTYEPKTYTVKFEGVEADDVTFPFDNPTVTLPICTVPGFYYNAKIANGFQGGEVVYETFRIGESTQKYTFSLTQLDNHFENGVCTIYVEMINEGRQNILDYIDKLNTALFDAGAVFTYNGESKLAVSFVPVEDAEGNMSIVLRVNPLADMPLQTVLMDVVMAIAGGGMTVKLNDQVFFDADTLNVYLQAMLDAAMVSGFSTNALAASIDTNGDLKEMTLAGTPVVIGTSDKLALPNAYGAQMMAMPMALDGMPVQLYITLQDFDQNASQLLSLRNNIISLSAYVNVTMANGKLNLSVTAPDKAYQAFLAAMLVTGNITLADVNDMSLQDSVEYLWNLIETVLEDPNTTAETLNNTLQQLGFGTIANTSLIDTVLKAFRNLRRNGETSNKYGQDGTFGFTQKYNEVAALINALNLPDMAAELIKDETLQMNLELTLTNIDNTKYEAIVLDVQAAGILNKIGFKTDLDAALNNLSGTAVVVLTADFDGSISSDKSIYLNLNGFSISGDVVGQGIKIIDSSLGDTGVIGGNVNVYADYRTNSLYAVAEDNGVISITLNADQLENPERPSIRSIAFSLIFDLVMNYYTSAGLYMDENTIYAVELYDLLDMLAQVNGEDVDALLQILDCAGLSTVVNKLLDDMTNFSAMAEAVAAGNAIVSFGMETKPWSLNIKRVEEGNYLTVDVVPSATLNKEQTVEVYLKGSEAGEQAAVELLEGLGAIVTMDHNLTLDSLHFANGTFTANAGATLNVAVNMAKDKNYAVVVAVLLANATTGTLRSELIAAVTEFVNSGLTGKLQTAIEKATVANLVSAVKGVGTKTELADILSGLGLDSIVDAEELFDTYRIVLAAVSYLLRTLDITGGNGQLGSFSTENGIYGFDKNFEDLTRVIRGYTVELVGALDVEFSLKLFGEPDPVVEVYYYGELQYQGSDIAYAFTLADYGWNVKFLPGATMTENVAVKDGVRIDGVANLDQNGYQFLISWNDNWNSSNELYADGQLDVGSANTGYYVYEGYDTIWDSDTYAYVYRYVYTLTTNPDAPVIRVTSEDGKLLYIGQSISDAVGSLSWYDETWSVHHYNATIEVQSQLPASEWGVEEFDLYSNVTIIGAYYLVDCLFGLTEGVTLTADWQITDLVGVGYGVVDKIVTETESGENFVYTLADHQYLIDVSNSWGDVAAQFDSIAEALNYVNANTWSNIITVKGAVTLEEAVELIAAVQINGAANITIGENGSLKLAEGTDFWGDTLRGSITADAAMTVGSAVEGMYALETVNESVYTYTLEYNIYVENTAGQREYEGDDLLAALNKATEIGGTMYLGVDKTLETAYEVSKSFAIVGAAHLDGRLTLTGEAVITADGELNVTAKDAGNQFVQVETANGTWTYSLHYKIITMNGETTAYQGGSFAEAMAAAEANGVVTLYTGVSMDAAVTVEKAVTILGAGYLNMNKSIWLNGEGVLTADAALNLSTAEVGKFVKVAQESGLYVHTLAYMITGKDASGAVVYEGGSLTEAFAKVGANGTVILNTTINMVTHVTVDKTVNLQGAANLVVGRVRAEASFILTMDGKLISDAPLTNVTEEEALGYMVVTGNTYGMKLYEIAVTKGEEVLYVGNELDKAVETLVDGAVLTFNDTIVMASDLVIKNNITVVNASKLTMDTNKFLLSGESAYITADAKLEVGKAEGMDALKLISKTEGQSYIYYLQYLVEGYDKDGTRVYAGSVVADAIGTANCVKIVLNDKRELTKDVTVDKTVTLVNASNLDAKTFKLKLTRTGFITSDAALSCVVPASESDKLIVTTYSTGTWTYSVVPMIIVTDASGKEVWTGSDLVKAFEQVPANGTITLNTALKLASDVTVSKNISIVGAANLDLNSKKLNLGEGGKITADAKLDVTTEVAHKKVAITETAGKFVHELTDIIYAIVVTDANGAYLYRGDSLVDAFAKVTAGAIVTLNGKVTMTADITVSVAVTIKNAANLAKGTTFYLAIGGQITSDAALTVETKVEGMKVECTGTYVYSLVEEQVVETYIFVVTDKDGKVLYQGNDLSEALKAAADGATLTINEKVNMPSDITIANSINMKGAANLNQGEYKFILTGKGNLTADAKLVVGTNDKFVELKEAEANGVYTYSLQALHPSYEGLKPTVTTTPGMVVGAKTETINGTNYIFLDVISSGITADQFRAVVNHSALNAAVSEITSMSVEGDKLVATGTIVTFTATNPASDKPATITYTVIILGDTNCDGKSNSGDATTIARHYINVQTMSDLAIMAADMNQDGKVNSGDATIIRRKYLYWEDYKTSLV